jgi:hypothetical protein
MEKRAVPDDAARAVGLAIAGFGPLLVVGALVSWRDDIAGANIALIFVVVVVLGAAVGTRGSGAMAALISAMSYDFFFTRPYQSLKIESSDDVQTAVLLLVIGLIVSELVIFSRGHRRASEQRLDAIRRIHRVAELVASGADSDAVVRSVQAELIDLLSLRGCRFERPPLGAPLPRLERNGALTGDRHRWVGGEYALPEIGAEIPVLVRGQSVGRLVLESDPKVGVSIGERIVAIALSDQLGAALAADAGGRAVDAPA